MRLSRIVIFLLLFYLLGILYFSCALRGVAIKHKETSVNIESLDVDGHESDSEDKE